MIPSVESLLDQSERIADDVRQLRHDLDAYVLRIEVVPLLLVVYGFVGVVLLGVLAALLLVVVRAG